MVCVTRVVLLQRIEILHVVKHRLVLYIIQHLFIHPYTDLMSHINNCIAFILKPMFQRYGHKQVVLHTKNQWCKGWFAFVYL